MPELDEIAILQKIHALEREGAARRIGQLAHAWLEREPTAATPRAALALEAVLAGEHPRAHELVQRVLESAPRCALAYYVRALLFAGAGRHEAAIACLQQAITLCGEHAGFQRTLISVLLAAQQLAEAARWLRRLEAAGVASAKDLCLLAELIMLTGEGTLDEAEAVAQRARALDAGHAGSWAVLSEILARTQRPAQAVHALEHALLFSPENPDFLHRRAILALSQHEPWLAIRLARRAEALLPDGQGACATLVDAFLMLHQLDRALEVLDDSLARARGAPDARRAGVSGQTSGQTSATAAGTAAGTAADLAALPAPRHTDAGLYARHVQLLAHAVPAQAPARAPALTALLAAPPATIEPAVHEALLAYVALLEGHPQEAFAAWARRAEALALPVGPVTAGMAMTLVADNATEAMLLVRFAPLLARRGVQVNLLVPDAHARLFAHCPGLARVCGPDALETARMDSVLVPLNVLPVLAGAGGASAPGLPAQAPFGILPASADPARPVNPMAPIDPMDPMTPAPAWLYPGAYLPAARAPVCGHAHAGASLPAPGSRTVLLSAGEHPDATLLDALGARLAQWGGTVLVMQPVVRWQETGAAVHTQVVDIEHPDALLACLASVDHVITFDSLVSHVCGAMGREQDVFLGPVHHPVWGSATSVRSAWYPAAQLHRCTLQGDWAVALASFDRTFLHWTR